MKPGTRVRQLMVASMVTGALGAVLLLGTGTAAWALACEDCPDGNPDNTGGVPTPQPPVPDAAFQFIVPPLGCLPPALLDYLTDTLAHQVASTLRKAGISPVNPDVRARCNEGRQTVALWFMPVGSYGAVVDTAVARDLQLAAVSLLTGAEKVAVRITRQGFRRQVAKQFERRRHMDAAGSPSPAGPIHLSGWTLDFLPAPPIAGGSAGIRFTTEGAVEVPVLPDVDFSVTTLDRLWLAGWKVQCAAGEPDWDLSTGVLDVVQVVTVLFGQVVSPATLFLIEGFAIADNAQSLPDVEGPGCKMARAIPSDIPVPGHQYVNVGTGFPRRIGHKMDMVYTRLDVNTDGITAAGYYLQAVRTPTVTLLGPTSQVRFDFGETEVSAEFRLLTDDLRDAPLVTDLHGPVTLQNIFPALLPNPDVRWSAAGGTIIHPKVCRQRDEDGTCIKLGRDWSRATISWPISPSQPLGSVLSKGVSVSVRDADGLTASAARPVIFKAVLDSSLPPICDIHPDHFECQP